LTIIGANNDPPYRMIVQNIEFGPASYFDEANGYLIKTKFSRSGKYIFTSSYDNKIRIYKYNSNSRTYTYMSFYENNLYGTPG